MKSRIVLGSRGSLLALAQVKLTREALQRAHPGLEIEAKIITTSGDRRQEVKAGEGSAAGLKGLFTKEIQDTMLEGEIDAAVHSLKDLPGVTPAELELGAVLPRERTSDLLISKSYAGLDALPAGGRVGTGSVRRRRQLQWLRPELEIVELRGNVPTRLEKLTRQGLDAIVLARAGLGRLGYRIEGDKLECDAGAFHATALDILPAIGQGAVGIEIRRDDDGTRKLVSAIDHGESHLCVRVERELLRRLDGDCRLPVAALATLDGETLYADAIVFPDDESLPPVRAHATGPVSDPEAVAVSLFKQLQGGAR